MGSLNANGMRDRRKAETIIEFIRLKNVNMTFLQETHSDVNNEIDWRMWCGDECILSHGTNLSAGVAIIFSPTTKVKIMSKQESEPRWLLAVRIEFNGFLLFL